jgi:hypothetical protein
VDYLSDWQLRWVSNSKAMNGIGRGAIYKITDKLEKD